MGKPKNTRMLSRDQRRAARAQQIQRAVQMGSGEIQSQTDYRTLLPWLTTQQLERPRAIAEFWSDLRGAEVLDADEVKQIAAAERRFLLLTGVHITEDLLESLRDYEQEAAGYGMAATDIPDWWLR